MQSLSDIFRRLPDDGSIRHMLRAFNLSPRVDGRAKSVKELAEALGFTVTRKPLPRGMCGRLTTDPFSDNGYAIEINSEKPVTTQRWAVLHEMGHYFLHVDKSDPFAFDMHLDRSSVAFYVNPEQEREANEFAAALLFGDGALSALHTLYGGNLKMVANHLGVSRESVEIAVRQFL